MKFLETTFEEYILSKDKVNLHPKLEKIFQSLPANINDLKNIILYGPPGVGKYTQGLRIVEKYSPSKLKYEKKLIIEYNKNTYYFKISDIHYEIDLSLLGCHSKSLWIDIYSQIVDSIMVKDNKVGIIICKNFQDIHNELLDIFYSYMQTLPNNNLKIIFILITESISFIPDNIFQRCKKINIPRPSRLQYNKCFTPETKINDKYSLQDIKNIKIIHANIPRSKQTIDVICSSIYENIINKNTFSFSILREQLYDILVYNLSLEECVWNIVKKLINENMIKQKNIQLSFRKVLDFLETYNNNYRPIFHLEKLTINLMKIVHDID